MAALQRLRAGAERSEHEQGGGLWVGEGTGGEGAQGGGQPLAVGAGGGERGEDRLTGAGGDVVVGIEEQLLAIVVEGVEGRARDAREAGDVDHAHGVVALQGDQLDERGAQAPALIRGDGGGVEPMGAGGQALVAARGGARTVIGHR